MGIFSIELLFDPQSETRIRQIWDTLAGASGHDSLQRLGSRPHLTLMVCDELQEDQVGISLQALSAALSPFQLSFSSVGSFFGEHGVVFLAPTLETALHELHRRVHDQLATRVASVWPHYLAGGWVPHCTVAESLPGPTVGAVLALAREQLSEPLRVTVERIALVRYRPAVFLKEFPFCRR